MSLLHDGYETHDINKNHYRYKGTIDVTPTRVNWTAEITLNEVHKGSLKGILRDIGDDDGPVRRAVDLAVKAAIQSFVGIRD